MFYTKVRHRVFLGYLRSCPQNAAGRASAACDVERHDRRCAGRKAVDDRLDDNSKRLSLTRYFDSY